MGLWSSKNQDSICLNGPLLFSAKFSGISKLLSPSFEAEASKRISAYGGQTTTTSTTEENLVVGKSPGVDQKPAWTDMKGPNGVEWYNVIIIILAVIGVFVNTCSLVVLIKKHKNSMFYKLLKVRSLRLVYDQIVDVPWCKGFNFFQNAELQIFQL